MTTLKLLFFLFLFLNATNYLAEEFVRNLPGSNMLKELTSEKYQNNDAVIILKEQSFQVQYDTYGPYTSYSKILIVKLINERAVQRYGTFEFEYIEKFGNRLKNAFIARVRVLKENGTINVLPKEEVKTIVSREDSDGDYVAKKVLFKIPNLSPGDILQIEYQYTNNLSFSTSGIFYYNDIDLVLYSNLYLTLPYDEKFKFYSLPENKIGSPQIEQISDNIFSGKTYFWSLRDLKPIPAEIFSKPFEETSFFTAFVSYTNKADNYMKLWGLLGQKCFEFFVDESSISNKQCELLGFTKSAKAEKIDFKKIDKLYTSIKKYFTLEKFNSLFPLNRDIDDLFDLRKGNASDLSILMHKVLENCGLNSKIVLIRDLRKGRFDLNVPSILWFDRMGVMIEIEGKEKVYDFDRCIANNFNTPWFLRDINIIVIDDEYCYSKELPGSVIMENNFISENHKLNFIDEFKLQDSLEILYCGSKAVSYRDNFYDLEEHKIKDLIRNEFTPTCFKEISNLSINNFYDEDSIKIDLSGLASIQPQRLDSFIVFGLNYKKN